MPLVSNIEKQNREITMMTDNKTPTRIDSVVWQQLDKDVDCFVFDCDGVIWQGGDVIDG